jgi:soluble lytic murein transglycosylase-like protein
VALYPKTEAIIRLKTLILAVFAALLIVSDARTHNGVPRTVDRALHHASSKYGVPYWEMRSVAWCESRWNPRAVGSGSYGLMQFIRSTWSATPYARRDIFDPWWNALAAAWLVRQSGGWSHWTCKPR